MAVIRRRNWSKGDELMAIAVVQSKESWSALVGWGDKKKWGKKAKQTNKRTKKDTSRRYAGRVI